MLSRVDHIALALPVVAYVFSATLYPHHVGMICLFGGSGCSVCAFVLWLHAQYLATRYLQERKERGQNRLRNILSEAEPQRRVEQTSVGAQRENPETILIRGKRFVGPRTVRRLDPALPALLSMLSLLGVAANILVAATLAIYELVSEGGDRDIPGGT